MRRDERAVKGGGAAGEGVSRRGASFRYIQLFRKKTMGDR
jgi:hypothetical protein